MKKFPFIFLIIILFILTACGNKQVDDKIKKSKDLENISEYRYNTTIKCAELSKNIKYFNYGINNDWFVTDENDVYVYDIYQLYSNDENCIKIDEAFDDIVFSDIDYEWRDNDKYIGNEVYYNSKFEKVSVDVNNYSIKREKTWYSTYKEISADLAAINDSDYIKYRKVNSNTAYGIKDDNNIYLFALSSYIVDDFVEKSQIKDEEIVFSAPSDEKILDFYYSSRSSKHLFLETDYGDVKEDVGKKYILTDKAYYRPLLVDENCLKYKDVECEYSWQKDEDLTKIRKDILYRDGDILITKSGNIYIDYSF